MLKSVVQLALAHVEAEPCEVPEQAHDEQAHVARRARVVAQFAAVVFEAHALAAKAFAVAAQRFAAKRAVPEWAVPQQVVPFEGVAVEQVAPLGRKIAVRRAGRMQAAARDIAAQAQAQIQARVDTAAVRAQRSVKEQGLAQRRVQATPFEASSCLVSTGQLLAWDL